MEDEIRLPNIDELGEEFQEMQELDDEALEYFRKYSPEILKRISKEKANIFINEYGCPEAIDEDNTLEDEFSNSLFSAYKSQEKLDYEDYLQDLVSNYFKI